MDFVHDLTVNGDFSSRQSFNLPRFLRNLDVFHNDDGVEREDIYNELVLTGDARTRQVKRYCIDYEQDSTMCDCCGRNINRKPWDFKKTSKLCQHCEEYLEKTHSSTMHSFSSKPILKPWNLNHNLEDSIIERRATNNILLWD